MSETRFLKVVGVTFVPTYPSNLHQLQALYDWQGSSARHVEPEPLSVVLRRNPDNRYDPNAIEVHVPALGTEGMIGHLSREHAAIIAPMMDAGRHFAAHVHRCKILPSQPQNPGIEIAVTRLPKDQHVNN